ncbi:MAG: alkaline phosphatase D family protein [Planctomycetota bacterium]
MPSTRSVFAPVLALLVSASPVAQETADLPEEAINPRPLSWRPVERIAFGSCFDPVRGPGDIWFSVRDTEPDVFVLLGDNIYGDTEDMSVMRRKYDALDDIHHFARLREEAYVLATWDDHDYGVNDGGAEYPMREESQEVMLDWIDEPNGSWRRETPGIYDVELFGPEDQRVQIILLDTRYFRSPLARGENTADRAEGVGGRYVMDFEHREKTLLGEDQWSWLEQVLHQPADIRIIASSIQVVAEDHRFEKWANLPFERARLFELLDDTDADGVVFISGDRHRAELSLFDPARATPGSGTFGDYPLYDITSSALNRSSRDRTFEERFGNEINRHGLGQQYQADNFGVIDIDWEAGTLTLQIMRDNGEPAISRTIEIDELR